MFVPVAFMGGIMGRFFYQFGITVGFAVLVSLYVSFTLDPMLSSRWYDPAADPKVPRTWFGRAAEPAERTGGPPAKRAGGGARLVAFPPLGRGSDRRRSPWLSSFSLFGTLGSAFMPTADQGTFMVTYKASPGISLERSEEIARS